MKRLLTNEKGLTLVEVLATLVIATIVMFIVVNIMLTSQNQYRVQSDDADSLFDVTILAKEITREIRKNPSEIETPNNHTIIFKIDETNSITYKLLGESIQKNNRDFVNGIITFHVEKVRIGEVEKVILKIESNEESHKTIDTEIVIR